MEPYVYIAPRTLGEAYAALGNGKRTAMLAGGTDIIVQMREGRKSADQVLDLKYIPELTRLRLLPDGTLELGAATPCAEIYEDAEVARRLPGLIDAASLIGSIQIQSRASIGGNICNAGPAADSAPALIALSAVCVIGGPRGTRELPVEQFFTGVGRNALQPDELLIQIRIPPLPARAQSAYLRFIPRNEMDIAVVGAGSMLQLDESGGRIQSARFGLGAVAPTPLLVPEAAEAIVGKAPTRETFELAGAAAAAAARPITDMRGSIAQRRHLSKVLTVRTLEIALTRIRENR